MKQSNRFFIVIVFAFLSCNNVLLDEDNLSPETSEPLELEILDGFQMENDKMINPQSPLNLINWTKPQIGQISNYQSFCGEDSRDNENFEYKLSSYFLKVEIIEKSGNLFKIHESTTNDGEYNCSANEGVYEYWIEVMPDFIRLSCEYEHYSGHLFNYNNCRNMDEEYLQYDLSEFDRMQNELIGWKVAYQGDGFFKFMDDAYEHDGVELSEVLIDVDTRMRSFDGAGMIYIYHKKYGMIMSSYFGSFANMGKGWRLLWE